MFVTGLYEEAAVVLNGLDRNMNGLAMARLRCISLERRRGNFSRVDELYKESISKAESTEVKSFYAIKYARYLAKVRCPGYRYALLLGTALESIQLYEL